MDKLPKKYIHAVDVDIFRESIFYSAAETGFSASLIEKDYYCSLILDRVYQDKIELVFKGGTCLSKVYFDFYRLSEDLDFVIPVSKSVTKSIRRNKILPIKKLIDELPVVIPGIEITSTLVGHNQSKQYIGYLQFQSVIMEKEEDIKLEIGLREPMLQSYEQKLAHTVSTNPFSELSLYPEFSVQVMNLQEALAEKVRAALTRREPAIRDYYDLFLAAQTYSVDFFNIAFLQMVETKLEVPGNEPIDVSLDKKEELNRQLETQLKPVLQTHDFEKFDLDQAFQMVVKIAAKL
ncbi:MAG: nucleotidyl transferase AbiEii/AbiGii toxin family protein [Candidatus Marinimicrobia bacterium]|nr:nucleotidyl transferase AbiEii/AbiGii toxin family protein [Candidatus Neomarinimicrobiota bacterium]